MVTGVPAVGVSTRTYVAEPAVVALTAVTAVPAVSESIFTNAPFVAVAISAPAVLRG